MAPEPVRGRRNEPGNVRYIAEKIAELRGMPFEELAERTTQNARNLFAF
jgi:TatD DNase family protein